MHLDRTGSRQSLSVWQEFTVMQTPSSLSRSVRRQRSSSFPHGFAVAAAGSGLQRAGPPETSPWLFGPEGRQMASPVSGASLTASQPVAQKFRPPS